MATRGKPANAGAKQAGRWGKGQSGNPAGKKPGTKHRATVMVETLLDGEAERLARKAVELALDGDVTALRLCLDRVAPVRKGRPVIIDLPPIDTADDVLSALTALVQNVATGQITPDEAGAVAALIDIKRKAIETVEMEARVSALEGYGV